MRNDALIWTGFTTLAMLLAGCESYRSEPLQPQKELATLNARTAQSVAGEVQASQPAPGVMAYHPEEPLTEAEMVMVALAFNPDLRGRRIAATQLGITSIGAMVNFAPELHVNLNSVTAGIGTDTEVLYTLLVPAARAAWYDADRARTEQARAEMLAAESEVAAGVRRSHLAVRVAWQHVQLVQRQLARCQEFADALAHGPLVAGDDLSPALVAWEIAELHAQARADHDQLAAARRAVNELLGFNPDYDLRVADIEKPLPVPDAAEPSDGDIDNQILVGRWELKASEALYRRDDYEARRKAFEQYPVLRLGPAITYNRGEGTSFTLGASMHVPWPEHAAQEYDNARLQRNHDRATYVARLHTYRAEAHAACARMRAARLELSEERGETNPAASRASDLIEQAWKAHAISAHDYLSALRQRSSDERRGLDVQSEWLLARLDLDHATGRLNVVEAGAPQAQP
jgi:outer membrane protein TolC